MRRLGVPPNAEMQARAEGRDPKLATAEVMMANDKIRVGGRGEEIKCDLWCNFPAFVPFCVGRYLFLSYYVLLYLSCEAFFMVENARYGVLSRCLVVLIIQ